MQVQRASRATVEALEVFVGEHQGQLNGTVGTEVEENDGIVGLHFSQRLAFAVHNDGRQHELVVDGLFVIFLNGLNRIGMGRAFAVHHSAAGFLHALPALVTVHGIITALDSSDVANTQLLSLGNQLLHVLLGAVRRNVAAVQERMDVHFLQIFLLGQLQKCEQVRNVAVHAAVGQKPVQVELGAVLLGVADRAQQGFVLEEISVADGLGNAGQVLIYDPACADIQVSNFRVAHLAFRQTYSLAASGEGGVRKFSLNAVIVGFFGLFDSIPLNAVAQSEAVQNNQCYRFGSCHLTSLLPPARCRKPAPGWRRLQGLRQYRPWPYIR
ncbi:hypothetical protein D3C75_773130 [compost metagenome]